MHIGHAIAIVSADAAMIGRYIERRERFLDALNWTAMMNRDIHESTMLDAQLNDDAADICLYLRHLAELAATASTLLKAVCAFGHLPRPWHPEWTALAN